MFLANVVFSGETKRQTVLSPGSIIKIHTNINTDKDIMVGILDKSSDTFYSTENIQEGSLLLY